MSVPCLHSLCAACRSGAGGPGAWWAGVSALACTRSTRSGAASQQQCPSPWTRTHALGGSQQQPTCIWPQPASLWRIWPQPASLWRLRLQPARLWRLRLQPACVWLPAQPGPLRLLWLWLWASIWVQWPPQELYWACLSSSDHFSCATYANPASNKVICTASQLSTCSFGEE